MARKKTKTISNMKYPIYTYLNSDNPYGNSVMVNGIRITTNSKFLIPSYEVMCKLKPIEVYLCFEPIEVKVDING